MAARWNLVTAVLVLTQTQPTRNSCLSECRCSAQVLDCSNTSFTEVPSSETLRGEIYTTLNMSFNSIYTLAENTFTKRNFSMLETLDLSNCNLKEIETYAFRGLNRMVSLYLANNNLNDLTEEVFEPLENLKELYLLGNQLTRILPQTLFPLKKLIVLDMSNNRISNIDKEAFTSLSGLKDLRLTGNVMRVFAPEAFNPLKNLQNLKLQLLKTSNGMSSPPPSKTELNNCLCERKTALDWCHGRRISCLVTCAYSHEKLYDGDSRVCTDILNSFNKTEVTGNRSVAATSLSWAVLITTAVIFLLTTTLIILAVVVRKTKAQTGDENYSAVIDSES